MQLRQYIENYILDEDEEGENEDLDIVETAKNPWIPFTIASMLIRRSEKWEDLKYAMEALSYVKEDIWDEFYGWEEYNLTPEFHT